MKKPKPEPRPVGTPRVLDGGQKKLIYLDSVSIEKARQIDSSNLSGAIRKALSEYKINN